MTTNPQFPTDWSHLLKKALMENFISCAVKVFYMKETNWWFENFSKFPTTAKIYQTSSETFRAIFLQEKQVIIYGILSPGGNYMYKISIKNTRTKCGVCSKLTIKTPERRKWRFYIMWQRHVEFFSQSPFWNINHFKDISQNFGLFLLKTVFSQNIFLHETIRISAAIKNFNSGKALA